MEALGIFLQHEQAVADTATLCSLLGTSRAVAQLAQTNCEGRVDLRYYKGSPAFSLWLRKNKRLLRSLNVSLVGDSLNPRGRPAAEKELARGLGGRFADLAERDAHRAAQQLQAAADAAAAAVAAAHSVAALTEFAASFPAGTLEVSATQQMAQRTQRGINEAEAAVATLRSAAEAAGRAAAAAAARADDQGLLLKAFSSPTPSLMVLQALPLGQLTSLDLNFGSREPLLAEGETRADKLQQFTAVIAEMSQLRSLSLQLSAGRCAWHPAGTSAEVLLRGVTTLQQLTELQLGHLGNTSADLQPPVSLRRLAVSCDPTRDKVPLHLAHLTELTELGLIGADVECAHVVVEEDQLPVSLRQLAVGDISSSEPLVGLTNLQSLTVYDCEAPAQLQQLSVLKATLREVRLSYSGTVQPADAAQNWAVLRLRSLKLAKAGESCYATRAPQGARRCVACMRSMVVKLSALGSCCCYAVRWCLMQISSRCQSQRNGKLNMHAAHPCHPVQCIYKGTHVIACSICTAANRAYCVSL
jgi:hypothetical protein